MYKIVGMEKITAMSLKDRGLVEWTKGEDEFGRVVYGYGITDAGKKALYGEDGAG